MPFLDEDGDPMLCFRDDSGDHWLAPHTPATLLFISERGFTLLDAIPPDTHVYHDFQYDVDAEDMREYYSNWDVPGRPDDEEGDVS